MSGSVKLFFAFAKVSMLTQMEYRMAFVVRTLGKLLDFGGSFAILAIILHRFEGIGGWSTYEVLLLYGLNFLTYATAATFAMPIHNISNRIRSGQLDAVLTRPVNPLYLLICQNASAGYMGNYVLGVGVLIFAVSNLDITITAGSVALLVVSSLGGVLIHVSALIATAVPSFWLLKNRALASIFYWEANRFVDYPIAIYSRPVQILLTFVLPYAFISFYPAGAFLGKTDQAVFSPVLYYLPVLVGVVCFWGAYQLWKKGLNAYESSGS